MKRIALMLLAAVALTGCVHPDEFGSDPAYSANERNQQIARNWDWEGKQLVHDVDYLLMLRPMGHLTQWNLR
jgi:hypothetical protein